MCSMVLSKALVPLVASSSTAFTVFRRDVTLVTMTFKRKVSHWNDQEADSLADDPPAPKWEFLPHLQYKTSSNVDSTCWDTKDLRWQQVKLEHRHLQQTKSSLNKRPSDFTSHFQYLLLKKLQGFYINTIGSTVVCLSVIKANPNPETKLFKMKVVCTAANVVRVHLGGALELQHAGVVVGFARCCLGGADEVPQGFGHILHGINEDHLGDNRDNQEFQHSSRLLRWTGW